jgi:hypothetical protein
MKQRRKTKARKEESLGFSVGLFCKKRKLPKRGGKKLPFEIQKNKIDSKNKRKEKKKEK